MFSGMKWFRGSLQELDTAAFRDPSESLATSGGFSRTATSLLVRPPAQSDLWRKTYYTPELIKDEAPALLKPLPPDATVSVVLHLSALHQFDQGGLLARVDAEHWAKFGLELVDRRFALSAVVTNAHSDWSTRPWEADRERAKACLRLHRKGNSIVMEAKAEHAGELEMFRIAYLNVPDESEWLVGPFAASPTTGGGCVAEFSGFVVGAPQAPSHSAEL